MKNWRSIFVFFLSLMMVAGTNFIPQSSGLNRNVANGMPNETIFDNGVWWINKSLGPQTQYPMSIFINGVDKGTTYLLEFGHRSGDTWPEIAAIYNTGYVRLAPPGLPFGTSFVLGPAYWGDDGNYVHTVQISRMDINTSTATPAGPIRLTIQARDYSASRWPGYRLAVTYEIVLPDPNSDAAQMEVTETYSVASAFTLSALHQAMHEGFKWAQFSSMYINSAQHDSDGAVYVDSIEEIQYVRFSDVVCNNFIYASPRTLSSLNPWFEFLHSDDIGIHGNTPNTIILVNSANLVPQTTPQGYITCSSDPNDDNVGAWINHDSAPSSFNIGDTGSIKFTLIAQDDPKEPPWIFSDVSVIHWARQYIGRLANAGITGGCGTGTYCPENEVTRGQMAVFLEKGLHYPSTFTPPNVTPTFNDTVGHWAEDWIEALKSDGITSGCGMGLYCPDNPVTRAQMAVFLLKSKHGVSYAPPPATGVFTDVPVGYWADKWIEQLALEGITGGCATGRYCPDDPVTRAQMAVFLVKTFNLP